MLAAKAVWKILTFAMLALEAFFLCFEKDASYCCQTKDIIIVHVSKLQNPKTHDTPQNAFKSPFSCQSIPKPNKRLASCLCDTQLHQATAPVSALADCGSGTTSSFGFLESLAPSVCCILLMSASGGLLAAFSAGNGLFIAGGL